MARLDEIEAVYRNRLPQFVRVAVAIVGEEQLARDAVHDGFVRAVRYRRRARGPAEPWIWRIVVNEARKRRARAARQIPLELQAEAATNGYDERDRVRAALAALPERQRVMLFLRHYADLDYDAIAAATGVAPGTVAATLNAARSKLREQLKEDECATQT